MCQKPVTVVVVASVGLFCISSAFGQFSIVLRSGGSSGVCDGIDPDTLVTSSSNPNPEPALIAGGNTAPECKCLSWNMDLAILPVTTHSNSDTWAEFTTTFELPSRFADPAMLLKVRADDGAEIALNGEIIGDPIDLVVTAPDPDTHHIHINDAELFQEGANTLEFYVPNTGNGLYGSPRPRGGSGDCMFLQFEAHVTYDILLRSGDPPGICRETDPNTLVTSSSDPDNPQPALISGGNTAPECACDAPWTMDPSMFPITTHSNSDISGDFTTVFEIPTGSASAVMYLKVRADDGAAIYLNDPLKESPPEEVIDFIETSPDPDTHNVEITGGFEGGTNTLKFYVPNTGNGHYGSPRGRGGAGDCMFLQFEVHLTTPCFPSLPAQPERLPLPSGPVSQKSRYLSFRAGDAGRSQAIRVTFADLPAPYNTWNGAEMWVGEPKTYCENGGQATPPGTGCGQAGGLPTEFQAATLQCGSHFADWSSVDVIHVFHEGIVPDGIYHVQVVAETCELTDPAGYSDLLEITMSRWGDAVGTYDEHSGWWPPDGIVGIPSDVTAVLEKFKNLPGNLTKARADLEPARPDLLVNITDVTSALDAFRGFPYPFEPSGPPPCTGM